MTIDLDPNILRDSAEKVQEEREAQERAKFNERVATLKIEHIAKINKMLEEAVMKGETSVNVDIQVWPHYPEQLPAIEAVVEHYRSLGFSVEHGESSELKEVPYYEDLSEFDNRGRTKRVESGYLIQHITVSF